MSSKERLLPFDSDSDRQRSDWYKVSQARYGTKLCRKVKSSREFLVEKCKAYTTLDDE